jgi:digeranylgeranylglycerophospholipid reductase
MKIKNEYDVVVVGIGPAGSSAARVCAEAGLSVLAVEKRAEIGSPKRCGEGLGKPTLKRMGLELDEKWVSQPMTGATVYSPNMKHVRVDYDDVCGWIIERKVFDKWLASKAADSGATLVTRTEVVGMKREDGRVRVSMMHNHRPLEVTAKIVVAADGVEAKVPRMLGFDTHLPLIDICSCVQFEMANVKIDPDRTEFFFDQEKSPGGYVWIFPKGKSTANVGIGVRKPWSKKLAYEYLEDFVHAHPGLKGGSIVEVNGGGVPVGGLMENMVADNMVIVGDAAHQVNPIHGGGIGEAYVGGKLAGQVVVEAIKAGDLSEKFLSKYNSLWWDMRGNKMKKILKLRKVLESMSNDELNWLIDYLKSEDLVELSHGGGLKALATLLMKKPRLILMAKKLL